MRYARSEHQGPKPQAAADAVAAVGASGGLDRETGLAAVGDGELRVGSDWEWRMAVDDSPEVLYGIWRDAVEWSRAAGSTALADGGLDQPSKLTTEDGRSPNVRRLLVDLHDEYARHVGHADLLREAVDGRAVDDERW
jgi:hypothetical protein